MKSCLWAWWRCLRCRDERRLPVHWKWHLCEVCNEDRIPMGESWTWPPRKAP